MSFTIPQQLEKKELVQKGKKMLNLCQAEKRSFTEKEQNEYDSIVHEIENLSEQIERDRDQEISLYQDAFKNIEGVHTATQKPVEWVDSHGEVVRVYDRKTRFTHTRSEKDLFDFFAKVSRRETRQLSSTDSAGGYLIPANLDSLILEKLVAKSTVLQAGAKLIELKSDHRIAKVLTWPTAYWRAENIEITASDMTFGAIDFTPKTVAILVKAARELVEDAPNLGEVIANTFIEQMAYEFDRVALMGASASGEPVGVHNMANLTTGADLNDAAISDFTPFLTTVSNLLSADITPGAILLHPKAYMQVEGLTATDNQPLLKPDILKNLQWLYSSKFPTNTGGGTSTYALAGDWTKLLLGQRNPIRIQPLDERYAEFNQLGFIAVARLDVQPEWPAAFAKIIDIDIS